MKSIILFFTRLTKIKKVVLLLSPILTLLISMKTALFGLSILIFLDLITGIGKNLREWGIPLNPTKTVFWKSIKSYLLRQTWRKAYEYGIGIVVVATFETLIVGRTEIELLESIFTLTELAIIVPAIIEFWSIFENIESVTKTNMLKRLITLLPSRVRTLFTGEKEDDDCDDWGRGRGRGRREREYDEIIEEDEHGE